MSASLKIIPPTELRPLEGDGRYQPSWATSAAGGEGYVNAEHHAMAATGAAGELLKAYEAGFQNGAVILCVGAAGELAAAAVRGALARVAISAEGRLPQCYCIAGDADGAAAAMAEVERAGVGQYAVAMALTLPAFRRETGGAVTPTLVLMGPSSEGVERDWWNLREMAAPGTVVLCANYGGDEGIQKTVGREIDAQCLRAAGRFGQAAMVVATDRCGGEGVTEPRGLPLIVFERVKELLKGGVDVRAATAPARRASLDQARMSPTYAARGWPYEPLATAMPETLPDGSPWPLISIVTPSFNYGRYLEQTILSVLNQRYPRVQHIVMDGGSTDETREVLERYRSRLAVCISEPDRGQSHAINKGFAHATGEILTWINADDLLAPGALHGMALAFWHSQADMVAGICEQYRNDRLVEGHLTCCPNGPLPLDELLDIEGSWTAGEFFMQPEVMFTRAMWQKAGSHVREDLFYSMDYELWLRFAMAGARLHVIGRPICRFRQHAEQKTARLETFLPELRRVRDEYVAKSHVTPADQKIRGTPKHRMRVASVSDWGFQRGAGIGQQRIMSGLAAAGHSVYPFAAAGDGAARQPADALQIQGALGTVSPDLVLVGNLHGAKLGAEVIASSARHWPTGVVLHDLWPLTGRCAYTGDCRKLLTGCDETCPTAEEYPPLAPDAIRASWDAKYATYHRENPPLLLANSEWTAGMARDALRARQQDGRGTARSGVATVRYGLDLSDFRPLPREFCRRELDLPEDRFLILASATSLSDERKGLRLLVDAIRMLALPDVQVVCLGQVDGQAKVLLPGVRALGYVAEPGKLAMVYSAVDLLVGPSREEAFGQVFTEAAACGTASVGFPVGGIPEALIDGVTGHLAREMTAEGLAEAIYALYRRPQRRRAMGAWGRLFAENEWSPASSFHSLHVALRKSGLAARINLPPKIGFVPHPAPLPAVVDLSLQRGLWQALSGFGAWDGPYPEKGLPRNRWLTGAVSRMQVQVRRAGPHLLRIACTTFHANAVLRVVHEGKLITEAAVPVYQPPAAGEMGQATLVLTCELVLHPDSGPIELLHWPWNVDDSLNGASILVFELDVLDPARRTLTVLEDSAQREQSAPGI